MPTVAPNTKPIPHSSSPLLNTISYLLIGVVPIVVTLFSMMMTFEVNRRFQIITVWALCTVLFFLLELLAEPIEGGNWSGYLNLMTSVAWLCLGFSPALAVILGGTSLAAAVRVGFSQRLKLRAMTMNDLLAHNVIRVTVSTLSLSVAAGVYALLNGQIPLRAVGESDALPLVIALSLGFITAQLFGALVMWLVKKVSVAPIWSSAKREQLLTELSIFPLIVVLPLILFNAGLGVFIVITSIVAAHAVRYRQIGTAVRESNQLYQHSNELVQKLSLVNRSVQNAMFNVDQGEALRTACKTAIAITQGSKAAIFLIQREHDTLYLADNIHLTEQHLANGRDLPYHREIYPAEPRIMPDTEAASVDSGLREYARQGEFRAFAEMPLRSGNIMLGYMTVYHDQPHDYTATELDLLEILANQLTAALDNTQLLRALELHAFEMTHLVHLSRISTSSLDLARLAADVSDVLRQMTAMDWVMIVLLDKERMQILGMLGSPEERSDTPTATLPQFPEVRLLVVQDTPQQMFFQLDDMGVSQQLRSFMELHHLQSITLLPMTAHENLFGLIFLGTYHTHALNEREEQLLETAANQIATQVYNVRVYKETHDALNGQLQQLALIEDIVQQISGSHDFNQIINDVFEAAVKTTRADMVALALLTDANDLWVIEQYYQRGVPQRHYSVQHKEQGVIGQVAQTGAISLVADNRTIDYYYTSPTGIYLSSLAVPLMKDGITVGVLNVESKQVGAFTRDEADFLKNLGGHAIISIENARLLEELQYQIDTLTSLRELSLSLSTAVDSDSVAKAVLKTTLDITKGDYAALFHYDRSSDQLIPLVGTERDHSASSAAEAAVLAKAAFEAAQAGKIQAFENIQHSFSDEALETFTFLSLIAVPIIRGNTVNEVLCITYHEQQYFENRDINTLNLLSIQAAGHLENALLHERIRDGNNRMRAILDSTRDGVILVDFGGRLIEVNPSAQRLVGLNLSEHIGEPLVDVLLSYSENDEQAQAGYSREELTKLARIQRLQPEGITRREFSRIIQPNQPIYVEEIGSPVMDDQEHVVGRLLVLRDITEEKQLEIDREQISSMAVHDLRSPLASIITALRIALENLEAGNTPIAQQTMQVSLASADKLMNLVNSLLDIRKGRHMSLERSATSMEELIELARLTLLASIEKADVRVIVDIPPNLPLVNVDAEKIRRVLINLLDNALRYTPSGKDILISVAPDTNKNKLLVKVADSGVGIPKAARERVFEQYWQVKENVHLRGSKGAGIGLAFCQRALEAHGERIWVADEGPLPGACFMFTLPISN
jgi:PAS domain S-box-containing protein